MTLFRVFAQMAAGGRLFSKSPFMFRHIQISIHAGEILFGLLGDDLNCPSVHRDTPGRSGRNGIFKYKEPDDFQPKDNVPQNAIQISQIGGRGAFYWFMKF